MMLAQYGRWLEYVLAICISLYGLHTILSFAFTVPTLSKYDDVLVPYCAQNYVFWLLTSMIFFLYGIFLLTHIWLVYLMFAEMIILLIVFICFLVKKRRFVVRMRHKLKKSREKKHNHFFRL
jgi:hypothetical protein